jgi:hypothetical protein
MATLVRSLLLIIIKMFLFIGLFVLSMRFIHTYPLPMPHDQQHQLITLSRKLGIRDSDDLYLSAVAIGNLVIATIEYVLIVTLWRHYWTKRRNAAALEE